MPPVLWFRPSPQEGPFNWATETVDLVGVVWGEGEWGMVGVEFIPFPNLSGRQPRGTEVSALWSPVSGAEPIVSLERQ